MVDPIHVLIVDDNAQVRSALGIAIDLFDDLKVVGEADNGKQALALCAILHPHIVLMDLVMSGMNGVRATEMIHQAYPDIRVIVLTSTFEVDLIQAALEVGAIHYLLKNVSIDELAMTIRRVSQVTI